MRAVNEADGKWRECDFSGWGYTAAGRSRSALPRRIQELAPLLAEAPRVIARGLGRSYGDAALNSGGHVLDLTALNRTVEFDRETGVIVCEAGMSLDDLIRIALPHGWFPAVVPGTRFVTVGGCIAADVHGKNHHHAGSFSKHVTWFERQGADGAKLRCSPKRNKDLFQATAGGMGLTGIISRAALQLQRVETSYLVVQRRRSSSPAETMTELSRADETWPFTVAWLDGAASGSTLGRGEIILGRPATRAELPMDLARQPLRIPRDPMFDIPAGLPLNLVNPLMVKVFNRLRYSLVREGENFEDLRRFHFPLDSVGGWNSLYGPKGFHQYQFVVPEEHGEQVVGDTLREIGRGGFSPALMVLKRFGEGAGWLSFPGPGWTLAVDLPAERRLYDLFDKLDEKVVDRGGRVYLAKDARLSPARFRAMYPDYQRWLAVKREVDPECRYSSDLSRRLRIDDDVRGGKR